MQTDAALIAFGPWSTTLALGMGFGTLVALLLTGTHDNRAANRYLAALLMVLVLKLAPYALGFAGFYDAYPWLSFAPFSLGLALGPLLYLHVLRLTSSRLAPGWGWHLTPAALQLAYYLVMFVQPLTVKNAWDDGVHKDWISPAENALVLITMGFYLALSMRRYLQYQTWLDGHLSNREEYRLPWLRNALLALAVMLSLMVMFEIASASFDFDYFQRFPLYLCVAALVLVLGLEGWRHAQCHYPVPEAGQPLQAASDAPTSPESSASESPHDWALLGQRWHARLEDAGWWRDPDLSLDLLARHLGTNTRYVSRAFNDGLGLTFNAVVNRLRVAAVQRELANPDHSGDLMVVAHVAGFSSRTSFHRLFKAATGMTPAQYRTHATRESAKA